MILFLSKAGANTNLLDHDHMSYIDHVVRDTYVTVSEEYLETGRVLISIQDTYKSFVLFSRNV